MSRIAEAGYGNTPIPGYKESTTSRDAAITIKPKAMNLRLRVYLEIVDAGAVGLTPDECSARLGESVLAIRPRFSELSAKQSIAPTGERRANTTGLKAKAFRATK